MSETVKLIIEIPDYEYKQIKEVFEKSDVVSSAYSYIYHGTPLDDVKAKIETYLSWSMFDEYGNETGLHKDLMKILDNIGKAESEDKE